MLNSLAALHRMSTSLWFSDRVTIRRWSATDETWTAVSTDVPCQVQSPRSASSYGDENIATPEEKSAIWVYADAAGVVVAPGDRLEWDGREFEVNAAVGDRTSPFSVRIECSVSQSALLPEMIRFRRRQNGAWIEVGTFPMRFTRSIPAELRGAGTEVTSASATMESTMTGDEASLVVEVGDWFGRDGFPGRVLDKDDHETSHVEFLYRMETKVP